MIPVINLFRIMWSLKEPLGYDTANIEIKSPAQVQLWNPNKKTSIHITNS